VGVLKEGAIGFLENHPEANHSGSKLAWRSWMGWHVNSLSFFKVSGAINPV
jgi:hypothetical protein